VVVDPTRGTNGIVVWNWDLVGEAFGATAPNQDPDGDANQFVFNMRFPGQRFDSASGLNYNYFRDYEPGTGRYSQSDPIGLEGGASTYGYVSSNPLIYVDPFGLQQSFADCLGERRWDWGKLGAAGPQQTSSIGNVVSTAHIANTTGNIAVGSTGSGIGTAPHATTWQHAAGSSVGQRMQTLHNGRRFGPTQAAWSSGGRLIGRVAVVTTVWEGFWNIGSMIHCGCNSIR
jgi:RHS repeat-associated protein